VLLDVSFRPLIFIGQSPLIDCKEDKERMTVKNEWFSKGAT